MGGGCPFIPPTSPQVQALTALSDDVLVSGANDGSLVVWQRLPNGREFASLHVAGEHTGMLRGLVPLPACGLAPRGGFATACLDKLVRVYAFDPPTRAVVLAATLRGHEGGVDSLSTTSGGGHLLSAGRDGCVRVWDLTTGACAQVLDGHENATRVLGLPDGNIVTGSAGRRNELDQHVDYKLRLWRREEGSGGAPKWVLVRVTQDHEQAVQDLDGFPDGGPFFVSASNDGTVKARKMEDLAPFSVLDAGVDAEGKPVSVFRARVMHNFIIAGGCEDNVVRLWNTDGLVDSIALPGTPWALKPLANGDLAVGCTHAGGGRVRGRGLGVGFLRASVQFHSLVASQSP